jgi:hypothetical protein
MPKKPAVRTAGAAKRVSMQPVSSQEKTVKADQCNGGKPGSVVSTPLTGSDQQNIPVLDMTAISGLFGNREPSLTPGEEDQMREESMWVYKSDPAFEKKSVAVNGKTFDVELGLQMREAWDYWDCIPNEDITCTDCGSLKDIYFIGLDESFFIRVYWPDRETFPFPQEISIAFSEKDPYVLLLEGNVYGSVLLHEGASLDVRGYYFFKTSPQDRSRIQLKRIKEKLNQGVSPEAPVQDSTVPSMRKPSEGVSYPLSLGPLTINDKDWAFVRFGDRSKLPLGGQKAAILRALYDLTATSSETARPIEDVLGEAGLGHLAISLSKPFSSKSSFRSYYTDIYQQCVKFTGAEGRVGKGKGVRDGKYYLVTSQGT